MFSEYLLIYLDICSHLGYIQFYKFELINALMIIKLYPKQYSVYLVNVYFYCNPLYL